MINNIEKKEFIFNIFLIFLLAIHISAYSPYLIESFFWFCHINLYLTIFGVLFNNKLMVSMAFVGGIVRISIWIFDFIINLFIKNEYIDFTNLAPSLYMFDPKTSLIIKVINFYHLLIPVILIIYLKKLGYDSRAFLYYSILFLIVMLISYFFTIKSNNINFVFSASKFNWSISDLQWFLFCLIFEPILFFLPAHFFCSYYFLKQKKLIKK